MSIHYNHQQKAGSGREKHRICFILLVLAGFLVLSSLPATAYGETCSLSVVSIPDKAVVTVNGTPFGTAPLQLLDLPCGKIVVTVSSTGYVNVTENITLENGKPGSIIANLQRLPDRGSVTIRTEPPGGDLFVDGNARGVTPLTVDNLLPGRHEILVRKTGYEDYHSVVSVVTGTTIDYTEYLVPRPGTGFLSITSAPEGANVSIDGHNGGTTPTNLERIGAGNHSVEISKPGYWNFTGIVNIRGGEATLAGADLSQIPSLSTLFIDSSPRGAGIYLNDTFKGYTPATLDAVPSGDYLLEFRKHDGSSVDRSFRFMPGSTHEIFAALDAVNGGSISDNQWQYQNKSTMMHQPGWIRVNTTPVIEKTYTWNTNGHEATVTLEIPQDLYEYYRNQPHPKNVTPDMFSAYSLKDRDRQYIHSLVNQLKDASDFKSYSARNDYRNVVAFVQSVEYTSDIDPVTKKITEYPKYPIETLADGKGDCEDTAILTAALLREMGYDVVVVLPTGHAAVAVACDTCNGYYFPFNGKRYYYLETTGSGYSLGTMDKEYQKSKAKIIPM